MSLNFGRPLNLSFPNLSYKGYNRSINYLGYGIPYTVDPHPLGRGSERPPRAGVWSPDIGSLHCLFLVPVRPPIAGSPRSRGSDPRQTPAFLISQKGLPQRAGVHREE